MGRLTAEAAAEGAKAIAEERSGATDVTGAAADVIMCCSSGVRALEPGLQGRKA